MRNTAQGLNRLELGGATREFFVDLPSPSSTPWGVVFSWHGYGQSAEGFRDTMAFDSDAVPGRPLVIITPEDTGYNLPEGLDWDIRGRPQGVNPDLALFEAVVGCLDAQYTIDAARIYSYGFSAGSVMTSLLHASYPELISAVVVISGAWFSDPAEVDLVNFFNIDWAWPELDPSDGAAVLMTHGGPHDVTVFDTLNLEDAAQAAIPYLLAHGRLVIDCPHGSGHTLHPELQSHQILQFLTAHRSGDPSPLTAESLGDLPGGCVLR